MPASYAGYDVNSPVAEKALNANLSDDGTIQVLLDRLNTWRLPRALRLKERVDDGSKLTEHDLAFLKRILEDSKYVTSLATRHPELQSLVSKLTDLYTHITQKALENERVS